jgi:hypothetical protein
MAELKTKATGADARAFIGKLSDATQRADAAALLELMRKASGSEPKMWGAGIIGFGSCTLRYPSGRELDWFPVGFAPRKSELVLYGTASADGREALLEKLGKHKLGKGCLYIKRLADVDLKVLRELIERSLK